MDDAVTAAPSPYDFGPTRNSANFEPLSPPGLTQRPAHVCPDHPAVVHGAVSHGGAQTHAGGRRRASAVGRFGIRPIETVSFPAPDIPAMYEAHGGAPTVQAVLNTINTRFDAASVALTTDSSR